MHLDQNPQLAIAPEVREALARKIPVVALESTVISHGLPRPDNRQVAEEMLSVVRKHGAVPAIIGVRDGVIKIGFSDDDLDFFVEKPHILKLSRGDLAHCMARKLSGATTVSASIFCASLAGIKVFATGGIGGVHRHAEVSFDISADLPELAKSPVLVVCSGAKAILDIPKTLEYLETASVPVIGFRSDCFPLFYSRHSQYPLVQMAETVEDVARLAQIHWGLNMAGLLLANPIAEEAALEPQAMERLIVQALEESVAKNITGKKVTPFLLARLAELSRGKSLLANKALLVGNASLAAQVAVALR